MTASASRLLLLLLLAGACATPGGMEAPPQAVVVERSSGTVRLTAGAAALERFLPAREPVLEGGECRLSELPADGVRTLSVHFPNRREADTSITITLDENGRVLRYGETRGVPGAGASLAELDAQAAATRRTRIQLDYVTGEAMVMNIGGEGPNTGVRGSALEFERTWVLGDLVERAAMVQRVCEELDSGRAS